MGKTCVLFRFSDDAFNTTFISTIGKKMGNTSTGWWWWWCTDTGVSGVVGASVTAGETRLTPPRSWKLYAGHIWLACMLSAWIGCIGPHRLACTASCAVLREVGQTTIAPLSNISDCNNKTRLLFRLSLPENASVTVLDTRRAAVMSVDPVASELTRLIAVLGRTAVMPAIK